MKESLRYLYQAELIATRTAQCVVEFHLLAAAGKTYHLTTLILTCFCIDSHTTPQDNLSNTLQHSGQSSAQLSMFSLVSVATHCRGTFWLTSSLCFLLCQSSAARCWQNYVSTCTTVINVKLTLHSTASTVHVFIWSPLHGSFVIFLDHVTRKTETRRTDGWLSPL